MVEKPTIIAEGRGNNSGARVRWSVVQGLNFISYSFNKKHWIYLASLTRLSGSSEVDTSLVLGPHEILDAIP